MVFFNIFNSYEVAKKKLIINFMNKSKNLEINE